MPVLRDTSAAGPSMQEYGEFAQGSFARRGPPARAGRPSRVASRMATTEGSSPSLGDEDHGEVGPTFHGHLARPVAAKCHGRPAQVQGVRGGVEDPRRGTAGGPQGIRVLVRLVARIGGDGRAQFLRREVGKGLNPQRGEEVEVRHGLVSFRRGRGGRETSPSTGRSPRASDGGSRCGEGSPASWPARSAVGSGCRWTSDVWLPVPPTRGPGGRGRRRHRQAGR